MNIAEVRQKFPQYSDMSDQQLADALHGKFYSDMPKDDFYTKIGLKEEGRGGLAEFGVAAMRGARSAAEIIPRGLANLVPAIKPAIDAALDTVKEKVHPDLSPTRTDATGKFINTAGELTGASVAGGGVTGVRSAITNAAFPALGGAVGEQIGGEPGKIIGSVAGPAAIQAGAGAAKNAIANKVRKNLETFRKAGSTPSVGQATDSVFFRGIENLAAKFPGGAGIIKNFIDKQQASFGARTRTGVSAEDAGRAIERGIKGSGGFLERTKATWNQLDDALAAKMPKDTAFAPTSTVAAFDDLTKAIPGAEKTSASMVTPKIAEWRANLSEDLQANGGKVPFEALRALRSRVGAMLDDSLVSGVPGGELKKLYGALSDDMERAAKESGAGTEFARQNTFYRSRMARVEDVLDRVVGKGSQPEDIFKRLMPSDPDQAGKVRAVMRSLDPSQRKMVSEAVVNRLGRASAGKQDDVGSLFSSETFLTNWNKLSDGAKAQLFPNHATRQNVESIANAASTIRQGSGIYANPSGTAGSFAAYSVYGSPIAAVAAGSGAPLVAAGGAIGTAYVGAKMLTNPKVVEWLAKPVNPNQPGAAAAHLARLAVIYKDVADPELRQELATFLDTAQGEQ